MIPRPDDSTPGTWQPILHSPRRPIVVCAVCRHMEVNESNLLTRRGWQETLATTPRRYRCGNCAVGS